MQFNENIITNPKYYFIIGTQPTADDIFVIKYSLKNEFLALNFSFWSPWICWHLTAKWS